MGCDWVGSVWWMGVWCGWLGGGRGVCGCVRCKDVCVGGCCGWVGESADGLGGWEVCGCVVRVGWVVGDCKAAEAEEGNKAGRQKQAKLIRSL